MGDIEAAVRKLQRALAQKHGCGEEDVLRKTKEGMYSVLGQNSRHVRVVRGALLIRVGGGWESLHSYCERMLASASSTGLHHDPENQMLNV